MCGSHLRTVLVHVSQVFGQGGQSDVFLKVPKCGGINLHPLSSVRFDPANLTEQTFCLQTHIIMALLQLNRNQTHTHC